MKSSVQLATALILVIVTCSVSAASPSPQFEAHQRQAIESAIAGCMWAIEDNVIAAYMKRRADAGHPAANEAEAKSEIESVPEMLPAFKSNCECMLKDHLFAMRKASTDGELASAISKMQEPSSLADPESIAAACLAPSPQGDEA